MIVQAITTKYLGPTNFRGGRIKASAAAGSMTMPYEHGAGIERNHAMAVQALANKYGWSSRWAQGGMPCGSGYCFVAFDGANPAFVTKVKSA